MLVGTDLTARVIRQLGIWGSYFCRNDRICHNGWPIHGYAAWWRRGDWPRRKTSGMRCLLLLGIVMAGAISVMLRALGRIIATVSAGDPFITDNAARLRTIGWSLLFIQLLDIPAFLIAHSFPALGSAAPDSGVSLAGWLAVLMTFVLARVFVVGAQMRDVLEGTV